jgi:hypothetical protein
MYFSNSKRASLIDRVKLQEVYNKPVFLNLDMLEEEKASLKEALKNLI